MKRTLIAAALAAGLAMPAGADDRHEVQCGYGWISFFPFKTDSDEVASVAILLQSRRIEQGWLNTNFEIGTLLVEYGYGWGGNQNEYKMPAATYQQILECLTGD